jgi:hypothetical protein
MQCRSDGIFNKLLTGNTQIIKANFCLFSAGSSIWRIVAIKSDGGTIYNDIYVFREALNEFSSFGERRPAFERQVIAQLRQSKKLVENPADPEILFHGYFCHV